MVNIQEHEIKIFLVNLQGDREKVVDNLLDDCFNRMESSNDERYKIEQLDFMSKLLQVYYTI